MNDKTIIVGVLMLLLGVGGLLFVTGGNSTTVPLPESRIASTTEAEVASGPLLPLAQCLKDNSAVFYGAFWCPHCEAQKNQFGDAAPALPYVECSTPDGNEQTFVCKQKGIKSYPTWKFADGSELSGEQSLEVLAQKTSCEAFLPLTESPSAPII